MSVVFHKFASHKTDLLPSDLLSVVKMLTFKAQYHCHSLGSHIAVIIFLKHWQFLLLNSFSYGDMA